MIGKIASSLIHITDGGFRCLYQYHQKKRKKYLLANCSPIWHSTHCSSLILSLQIYLYMQNNSADIFAEVDTRFFYKMAKSKLVQAVG
jgi:hypothetical protein